MRLILLSILLVSVSLVVPDYAGAQGKSQAETTISVAPAILDISGQKGKSAKTSFQISNPGKFPLPINLETQSLVVQGEEILDNEAIKKVDASTWIDFEDNKELVLDAGQSKIVPVTINVPENASPGGHYAQISVRGLSLEAPGLETSTIVIPEISLSVLITIEGQAESKVSIDDNNIFPFFISPGDRYGTSFKIKNEGNIHDLISPVLLIKKNGTVIKEMQVGSGLLLPSRVKTFENIIEIPKDRGVYDFVLEVRYGDGSKLISSSEKVVIGYTPLQIFWIGIVTFIFRYIFIKRKNIRTAIDVLLARR